MEEVILVDEQDEIKGYMEKMEAHRKGVLHRAFSVIIYNSNGDLLLQKRAASKYHSPLLWTNACCSHPRRNESVQQAADRRLREEMGISCKLEHVGSFIYKADLDKGLTEHELDHVFKGTTDDVPVINMDEVDSYGYFSPDEIKHQIRMYPESFTAWFRILAERGML